MKLRSPLWTAAFAAPVGVLALLPLPLVEPGASYADPVFWYAAAALSGAVLLVGLVVVRRPSMVIEGDRLLVRGAYGWSPRTVLAEGERWVVAGDRLCLQRGDGSLERTRIARRMVDRRDWERLRAAVPVLDPH
ncbi:hypothetical protein [Glycomyces harbinensis]|uniref:PH domain-containing protein n=1 Tax=Glycomyces harbinensis TaxID=58114 RepID=A0A1G6W534_9ACTN|nr:hypothetical protein [Glycomyces harbinensis]SDD60934.1 hypothetical protein SAMN05216270_105311 [Glycomyces harbinensis]